MTGAGTESPWPKRSPWFILYGLRQKGRYRPSVVHLRERPYSIARHPNPVSPPVNVPSTALAPARHARREPIHQEPLELNTFADAAVANDAAPCDPSALPGCARRPPRRRVLTHEEEVDLSQRIEAGERDALYALLGTAHAAVPLRALAAEVREALKESCPRSSSGTPKKTRTPPWASNGWRACSSELRPALRPSWFGTRRRASAASAAARAWRWSSPRSASSGACSIASRARFERAGPTNAPGAPSPAGGVMPSARCTSSWAPTSASW